MKKAALLLPLGLVGLLFACAPSQATVAFPSQKGEADYASFSASYAAAKATAEASDGFKLDAKATGTLNYASNGAILDINELDATFSLTAVGLNEKKVDDLALGMTSKGKIRMAVEAGSDPLDIDTPIDASVYLQDGRMYADLTKIDWASIAGNSSLPAALSQKVVTTALTSDEEAANTVSELRSMLNEGFFNLGPMEGGTYYEYSDGSVGLEVTVDKESLAMIIAMNLSSGSTMEETQAAADEIAKNLSVSTCVVKMAYGNDVVHYALDMDFTYGAEGNGIKVDMTVDIGIAFSDELDVSFPTDLDAYVEAA